MAGYSRMPGSGSKFIPNPAGFVAVAVSSRMVASLGSIADSAAQAARAFAPRKTGDYANGITSDAGLENGRVIGRVIARDFKSNWIEMGTYKMGAWAPLTRGVQAVTGQSPSARQG